MVDPTADLATPRGELRSACQSYDTRFFARPVSGYVRSRAREDAEWPAEPRLQARRVDRVNIWFDLPVSDTKKRVKEAEGGRPNVS